MSSSDYYQLLGVARDADRQTIRAAYRKALRRHHPDANAGSRDGEQILLQVITAGRILSNQELRARYDQDYAELLQQTTAQAAPQHKAYSLGYHKLLLGCVRILQSGKLACLKFFGSDQAQATEARAARQRRRKAPGFNFYLYRAIKRKQTQRYKRGEDGIYRKESRQTPQSRDKNWRKRTAI